MAVFTSCRTKHQLSRQSQNFHLPWTVNEAQKHPGASAFTRLLYALLTVNSKSCFPAPTMNSIATFCGLICNQTELFHAVTCFGWGGDSSKTKCRKITLQFLQDATTCLNSSCHNMN